VLWPDGGESWVAYEAELDQRLLITREE